VLLVGTPLRLAEVTALAALGVPGVTVSSGTPVAGWPGYRIDDVAAARTATAHLIGLGHTRIAHLTVAPADELSFTRHPDRRAGYRAALTSAGLPIDPLLTVAGEFTVAGGEQATRELLRRPDRPTAIFAACDEMAMGALRELRRARVRVPDEMSVIGIDDHDLAGAVGLTTIAQPAAAQGRAAAASLLRQLRGEPLWDTDPAPLATELVIRETTGRPPR
jgi:DNA-binding LacI/PurR family transcriptional regulator